MSTPADNKGRREFYEAAVTDEMPDAFAIHLNRNPELPPNQGFSEEAFEEIGYHMHDWTMARVMAYYNRHGRWPSGMRIEMRVRWDDRRTANLLAATSAIPWYALDDPASGEMTVPDGERRMSPFIRERREYWKKKQ
jgi:hypothetical protein